MATYEDLRHIVLQAILDTDPCPDGTRQACPRCLASVITMAIAEAATREN